MKCCCKCKGENFVKVAKSTVVPTLKFYLCQCGNVMMQEAVLGDILLPTPENGPLAKFMMEDAAKALGMPVSLGYLKEEDVDAAANNFLKLVKEYFASEEDEDTFDDECDDDYYEYDDYCDECGECEEYCCCDEEEDEEDLKDMVNFIDLAIKHANLDSTFASLWNEAVANGEINKIVLDVINEKGFDLATLIDQKKQLLDIIPDEIRDEATLAKLMGMILSKDLKETCDKDKEIEKTSCKVPAAMKIAQAIKENMDAYDEEIEEDEEDRKSYVVLNRNGSWKVYGDMTREEMSEAINEDDGIEDFLLYEIKKVAVEGKVVFSVQ